MENQTEIKAKGQNFIISMVLGLALLGGGVAFAVPQLQNELVFNDAGATVFFFIGVAFYVAAFYFIFVMHKELKAIKRLKAESPAE